MVIHRTAANKTPSGRRTSETSAHGPTDTQALEQTLRDAAMEILKHQSALLYADNLLQNQQRECFSEKAKCDFHEAREKYGQIAAGGGEESHESKRNTSWTKRMLSTLHLSTDNPKTPGTKSNAPWAELMLSKLDELDGNYEGAIRHASKIDQQSKRDKSWEKAVSWAYYNWGVALNDLGCYQAGVDVLKASVTRNPSYAPAHNALARSYNALAAASINAEPKTAALTDFRAQARAEATKAVELDPGYQEAFVNLGDALRPQRAASTGRNMKAADDGNEKEAREAYEKAIALNVDTAGRARQQLASMPGGYPATVGERIAKKRPECRQDLPPSLLEASGCSDTEIRAAATHGSEAVRIGLTGSHKAAGVCTNPALLLPQSDFIANPVGKSGQITEVQRDVEGTGRLHTRRQRS
ncbi:hypothetical protein [Paraburkholderia panacisoli]|uniref:hypothetical protein n=1 Tax=Paraburkholderia panacisoli TaxID=2603818 RepID=UPI00165EE262|nr:hypothetical protein [Paraburkholderia panacisoli]